MAVPHAMTSYLLYRSGWLCYNQRSFSSEGASSRDTLSREQRIRKKLEEEFKPSLLEVIDHSGGCPGGTVQVRIESNAFKGKSPVASHRMVYNLLSEEMKSLHALPLEVSVPKDSK
eukprot:TRINITY_DN4723_c0_g2_i2.p1 TRINITY_DN4723_c0_g2~~TRINITY_DN4723_c0_g2_i2.p1  ORF type:complete len:129 (+),score=25.14 TRINITY_DN4723_c0_g2_i2:42-389(+)